MSNETTDEKPINGHDASVPPTEDQPMPERTELDVANERVVRLGRIGIVLMLVAIALARLPLEVVTQ